MTAQAFSSPPFSTAGLGPCDLTCFCLTDDGFDMWVFWSICSKDEIHIAKHHDAAADADPMIKSKIVYFLHLLLKTVSTEFLAQFWGLVKVEGKMHLTTRDNPFALKYWDVLQGEKLCEYRKHCLKYVIPVDEDEVQLIGPPGRVFRSGFPEYTHDVRYYTTREYPQHDDAVGRVRGCWALPAYHPDLNVPSGVLEIVSSHSHLQIPYKVIQKKLKDASLTTTCLSLAEASSCRGVEIAKIDEVLSMVRRRHELPDTETWATSEEILSLHAGYDFIRKGQGVVGRAYSSKSACFCRDIRQLSITEYPLVPNARHNEYSACFAVCLQSSCSNNCIYVLEFFLPRNEKVYGDPRTLLHMLMKALKEHLGSSFEIASGQELGRKLTVEVIKVSPEDEFDSFEICNSTGIEPRPKLEPKPEHVEEFSSQRVNATNACINGLHGRQNGIVEPKPEHVKGFVNVPYQELMPVQFSSSNLAGVDEWKNGIIGCSAGQELAQNIVSKARDEPTAKINVANPGRDGGSLEQCGDDVANIKKQKPSCTLKSEHGITLELLKQNSSRNLGDAAKVLGVSRATLKRICRECGIYRWPPRRAREANQAFAVKKIVHPSTEEIQEHHRLYHPPPPDYDVARVDAANNSTNGIYEQQNGSSPRQELVQNIEKIAHEEPNIEIDVAKPESDGASLEQSGYDVAKLKMQKPSLKSDLGITREVLEQHSMLKLEDAAKILGVSRSTLKRMCREFGIPRWPPGKARKVNQAFAEQKIVQPSTEDTHEHHQSDATRLEDVNGMWVKAEYQGDVIKFRLPFSARKIHLEGKVAQRLNLAMGSFKIECQDEDNDWICITCDEDLSTVMSALNSLGRTTIKMLVN